MIFKSRLSLNEIEAEFHKNVVKKKIKNSLTPAFFLKDEPIGNLEGNLFWIQYIEIDKMNFMKLNFTGNTYFTGEFLESNENSNEVMIKGKFNFNFIIEIIFIWIWLYFIEGSISVLKWQLIYNLDEFTILKAIDLSIGIIIPTLFIWIIYKNIKLTRERNKNKMINFIKEMWLADVIDVYEQD